MGQSMGRIPQTQNLLLDEWRRVLHWSAEILARIEDNIKAEHSFLLDYNNAKINAKVDAWLKNYGGSVAEESEFHDSLGKKLREIRIDVTGFIRKKYKEIYRDLNKFIVFMDKLAAQQQKVHKKLLKLKHLWPENKKTFCRRLGSLRITVFKNLRKTEKMLCLDKRLKEEFIRKVCDIDHKSLELCKRKMEEVLAENSSEVKSKNARYLETAV